MNTQKIGLFAITVCGLALGCYDTARAQAATFTLSPNPINFTNVPQNSSPAQAVTITSSMSTTVAIQTSQSWLTVNGGTLLNTNLTANIGSSLTVAANTTGLTPGQTYVGTISVAQNPEPPGASSTQFTVNVTVSAPSLFTASPTSLSFAAPQGASQGTPASANVSIGSSGATLLYNLSVTTSSGGNWLLVSTSHGTTGSTTFQVSVNPGNLAPATYTGTITAQSTTTADSVAIPVSLTVTSGASLTVSPSTPITFLYSTSNQQVPSPQTLSFVSSSGTLGFSISDNPPVSWLVVSPLSGTATTAGTPVTLSLAALALPETAGVYKTQLTITPTGGQPLTPIPVTLIVSGNPLLTLSTTSLVFSAALGSATGLNQQVMIGSTGSTLGFSISSNQPWLSASVSSGSTPASLVVSVSPSSLPVGQSTGILTVVPNNGDQYVEQIQVTVNVSSPNSQIFAGPPLLVFAYQTNEPAPQPQNIELSSTGQPVSFTIATQTSNCGTDWLTASIAQTQVSPSSPVVISVGIASVAGLTAGACSGNVSVSYYNGASQQMLNIPITLNVSASPELNISLPQGFGNFTSQYNSQGAAQILSQISLTSTSPATQVSFSALSSSTGGAWLLVGSSGGTTPQSLTVSIQPGNLVPSVYNGTITITSPTLPAPVIIPVTLTVTPNVTATVSPTSVAFTEAQNGPLPAAQTLTIATSGAGATFAASVNSITGGNWLSVSPTSGSAPGTLTVTVTTNQLLAQTYSAQILVSFQNSSSPAVTIPVTLTVTSPQSLTANVPLLNFSYQIGGTAAASQTINLTSTGGGVAFTAGTTTTSGNWLTVSPTSGTTPSNGTATALTVTVNPANISNITATSYTGTVTISAPGVLSTPITIPVTLNVSNLVPSLTSIKSNASFAAGAIAPGEMIAIFGANLAPASPASGTLFTAPTTANGTVSTTLNGIQVMFGSTLGTPIYVSPTQINVIVPWEIAGQTSTNITIVDQGISSTAIQEAVTNYAPGLYTAVSGIGQAAALNQNNSVNNSAAPAARGTVIQLFVTGLGQTSPASTDGSVNSTTTLMPLPSNVPVSVTIGGLPATVNFAGAAPGLVTGVMQINAVIPAGINAGSNVPVLITVGGITSPTGVTIAVQ